MPRSKLRLRSGLSPGLSVNAMSNAVGGLMPVPAPARIFVQVATVRQVQEPRCRDLRIHRPDDVVVEGRPRREGERIGFECVARDALDARRRRLTNARGPSDGRPSTNQPEIDRLTGNPLSVLAGHERVVGTFLHELPPGRQIEASERRYPPDNGP